MTFLKFLFTGLLVVLAIAVVGATAVYATLARDLPPLSAVEENRASFKTAQIFDRHGTLLWELNDPQGGKRVVVPLQDIAQPLIDATLAAEDANFYQHPGFDLGATARSAFITLSGEGQTGASTITQQLVRNVLLDPEEAR